AVARIVSAVTATNATKPVARGRCGSQASLELVVERCSIGRPGEGLLLRGVFTVLVSAAAAAALLCAGGQAHAAAGSPYRIKPVPSLDPAATNVLWHRLAHGHRRLAGAATSDCRPLRVVFYAPTD